MIIISNSVNLLLGLRPKIVLVEEAAETLEAPITAACVPSLDHLILVGDHQQLRPHCQVHKFEDEPYYFNLSLFERMVFNDIEFENLTRYVYYGNSSGALVSYHFALATQSFTNSLGNAE